MKIMLQIDKDKNNISNNNSNNEEINNDINRNNLLDEKNQQKQK